MACPCKPFFISGSRPIHISKTTCFSGNRYNVRNFSIPSYPFLLPKSELCSSFSTMLNTPATPKALLSTITSSTTALLAQTSRRRASPFHIVIENSNNDDSNYGGWNNNNGNNNKNNSSRDPWWWDDGSNASRRSSAFLSLLCCCVVVFGIIHLQLASSSLAKSIGNAVITEEMDDINVSEVKGSNWIRLIPDFVKDEFLVTPSMAFSTSSSLSIEKLIFMSWSQSKALLKNLLLPEGFPDSVTSDYLEYSLWRGVQGIASQMSGVLATQALLYAVGLGKGAIPTAAAINWVLKDGIGYLSKIMLSKYGRHFDVHPKGWRLFADLLENSAFGLEMLTPVAPHLFVLIGAVAGSARSAATLIQAATRSCFYAGFAAQRNFAEVIAKGEAQGMLSKFIGIFFGITLANRVGSSTPHALASFCVITAIHMFCNLKSYQSIQLRTLNPHRASLVFTEYLLTGQAPPIKEVNDEEPLFPAFPYPNIATGKKATSAELSSEAREAAIEIERRLELGSKLSSLVQNKDDVLALFHLYKDENYILTEHNGKFCVVLKENSSAQDMLKSLFQVNYLYWLERNVGIEGRSVAIDCKPGGKLQISLEYVQREFEHVKNDSEAMGWIVDGLISRPLPNKICVDASTAT